MPASPCSVPAISTAPAITRSCCGRPSQLTEALGALAVTLTPADLARLDQIAPPGAAAGDRYDHHAMTLLDSERDSATR